MGKTKIIKNNSQGYGYKYANLVNYAEQGVEIPKMKTDTDKTNLKDYVYYYDEELKDWIRGAEIVIPENIISKDGKAKMNAAQLYGSAVTYARRVTVQMAESIACGDDVDIENAEQVIEKPKNENDSIKEIQIQIIQTNGKLIADELKLRGIVKPSDLNNLTIEDASELCKLINERKK